MRRAGRPARSVLLLAPFLLAVGPTAAEVTHRSPQGFATSESVEVGVGPSEAWAVLVHPELWWNPDHSWGGDAAAFRLDQYAGGCFCEDLPDGGSVEHLRVVFVQPYKTLRMKGALGPLQGEGLDGTLTVELAETSTGGTRISWEYVVGGFARYDLAAIADPVDRVQDEQLRRLAALLSTGSPEPEAR